MNVKVRIVSLSLSIVVAVTIIAVAVAIMPARAEIAGAATPAPALTVLDPSAVTGRDRLLVQRELFPKYDYQEAKDLGKAFITILIGVFVLSITFSEKIVNFSQAPRAIQTCMIIAWALLILSIVGCGLSLGFAALAAGQAIYVPESGCKSLNVLYDVLICFRTIENLGILTIAASGVLFTASLVLLLVAAIWSALHQKGPDRGIIMGDGGG